MAGSHIQYRRGGRTGFAPAPLLALLLLGLACSGAEPVAPTEDPAPPDAPATPVARVVRHLILVDPVPAALAGRPVDLTVRALDSAGQPVDSVPVTFSLLQAEGSLSAPEVLTDADGIAVATWTPGPTLGWQRVRARAQQRDRLIESRVQDGSFASASMVSGSNQEAPIDAELEHPLVVRTLDAEGAPAFGVAVTWAVASGGGTIVASQGETDAAGEATARWRLGPTEGIQQLQVTVRYQTRSAGILVSATAFTGIRIGPALPGGRVAWQYDIQMQAAGAVGATSWTVESGAMPPGIGLTPEGRVAGVPTASGIFDFVLTARDAAGTLAQRDYRVQVCPGPRDPALGSTVVATFPDPCGVLLTPDAGREYRIGVMARGHVDGPASVPGGLLVRTIRDLDTAVVAGIPPSAAAQGLRAGAVAGSWEPNEHLRRLEADRRRFGAAALRAPALGSPSTYTVTDPPATRSFHYITGQGVEVMVPATLRHLSPHVAYYQDDSVASDGGTVYSDARIADEIAWFEQWGMAVITDVFGGWGPSGTTAAFVDDSGQAVALPAADLDRNGRVIALQLRPSLATGFVGMVTGCDRFPRPEHAAPGSDTCATSNEGEIVYVLGPGRFLLTHEAKHVSSLGWGILGGRGMHPGWIEEGTAVVASEKASRLASGVSPTTRAGPAEILPGGAVTEHTQNMWAAVAGARRFLAAAPVASLTGYPSPNPGGSSYYTASWFFHRFLEDAYGTGDGIAPLFRQNTADVGIAGIETLTGASLQDLLVRFMAAIAVDDVPAARAAATHVFRGYDFGALADAEPYPGYQLGPWPIPEGSGAFGDGLWSLDAWYTAATFFSFTTDGGRSYLEVLAGDGVPLQPTHDVVVTVTRVR